MIRVLFCIGVNQNFFDAPPEVGKQVWAAFGEMMKGIERTDGIQVIGNMDDDRVMVGPSTGWPWTTYVLADAHDFDAVTAACNLFRSIQVGPQGERMSV
ncbi:IacB protein [Raoultella ornithinolytica]|uniref:IacB protein n=1 Tax=Raoultella ornithinolytica TaxID=54291 RepID=UPI0021BAB70F|nr:IacB protein [Raoultella ornithinolytica]MCT8171958.1 IacB protein [Raoultella ornithinolytica]